MSNDEQQKSPQMEGILNEFTQAAFGRKRSDDCCVICGNTNVKVSDFRNKVSIKEFSISRMCQKCQDDVFGTDEPE